MNKRRPERWPPEKPNPTVRGYDPYNHVGRKISSEVQASLARRIWDNAMLASQPRIRIIEADRPE